MVSSICKGDIDMIGLTGGIASGKSTVTARLRVLGAYVADADIISREVMKSESVLSNIRSAFGDGVFLADGSLNRSELARVVFASPERVALLDSITHPAISKHLLELVFEAEESGKYPLIFVDAALLIESGFYKFCDKIWLVTSNTGMRVRRIVLRDGIDHKAALKRISSQMPDEQKLPYASLVIENNGTIDDLIASVDKAFNDELSLNGFAQSSIS